MEMSRPNKKYLRQVASLMKDNGYYLIRNKRHPIYGNDDGDRIPVPFSPKHCHDHILKRIKSDLKRRKAKRENRDF
jgi:predicted RNA binding protein YcfA (HicA-like mRNA interferase family)